MKKICNMIYPQKNDHQTTQEGSKTLIDNKNIDRHYSDMTMQYGISLNKKMQSSG